MEKRANIYSSLAGKSKESANCIESVKVVVKDFIAESSNPTTVLQEMRPLYLDGSYTAPVKQRKPKQQRQSRPLSAAERRQLKVYHINPKSVRYQQFLPLHQLWLGYMRELMGDNLEGSSSGSQQFAQKLLKADFHGAILTVTKSKNPLFIGVTGIMIQETMNVFSILTKNDQLKKISKAGTVFLLEIEGCKDSFTLYGQQLVFRAAERAVKKFKIKPTIDL